MRVVKKTAIKILITSDTLIEKLEGLLKNFRVGIYEVIWNLIEKRNERS